jgi:hypothetical protein
VARSAGLRKAIRAHIAAGGLAVAGIAGLGVAYLFPLIIAASSKGGRTAAATTGLIALGSLAFAIVVWLVFYLPVSVAAGMIAKKRSARLGLSALLCTLGLSAAVLWLMHRFDQPPHFVARSVLLMMAGILGSGCALYSFLKGWIAERVLKERSLAP